jgi:hypothetical protein
MWMGEGLVEAPGKVRGHLLMKSRMITMLAVLALPATLICWLPLTAAAQTPGPLDTDVVDPPNTVYSMGAAAEDPAVERRRAIVPHHRDFLPLAADLSIRMPPVGDQGHLGACAAWAVAYAARSYYTGTRENRNIRLPANLPSPNYVFHLARQKACDDGTNVGRIVEVLKKGALSLADFPYSDRCVPAASQEFVDRAHDFQVRDVKRVDISTPDDIKGQLMRGNPVLIRMFVGTAFEHLRGSAVFTEASPPPDDKNVGWHFMTLVGYDEQKQAFRLINSWSPRWGDRGYAWISYNLLHTRISHAHVLDVGLVTPEPGPVTPAPVRPDPTPVPVTPVPSPEPVTPVAPVTPPPGAPPSESCSRLTLEKRGDQAIISGYVATDEDLKRAKEAVSNTPNAVLGNLFVAPWPQCEALQTLEKLLAAANRPTIDIDPSVNLHGGDTLRIRIGSPAQISYLYVSYIQADGSVVHLVQPSGLVSQPTMANQTLEFGSGEGGKPKFTVSPPFGREMVIAIAARSPLFDHELPRQQTEREYLTALRRALVYKPDPAMPDRELSATIATLQTSARSP